MTLQAEKHVSLYEIRVDGQEIAQEHLDRIREIRVVDYLKLPDTCTIHVGYPKGEGIDHQPFTVGKPLEIRLGEREAMSARTLFKGDVVTVEPEFGQGGVQMIVRAYDRAHLLQRAPKRRAFQNMTTGDIVAKVVKEAGLSVEAEPTGGPHDYMLQNNETDWDFIWRLADAIGFELVVDDRKAVLRRIGESPQTIELEWPGDLITFRPRVTAVQQVEEVTVAHHDAKTKKLIEASAKAPNQVARIGTQRDSAKNAFKGASVHIASVPVRTRDEAQKLAQAELDRLANGYVSMDAIAHGNPDIKAGVKVRITGVGSAFGGEYRIQTSKHVLRGGGAYETHMANGSGHTITGLLGGSGGGPTHKIHGLVIGIVTNNNDPQGLGRVRVQFPWLSTADESFWARVATPSAGKERGLMMLPVPGEEVLCGFEHGDPSHPFVVGSLFNGVDKPGTELADTKGGMALRSDETIAMTSKKDLRITSGAKMDVKVSGDRTEEIKGKSVSRITGTAEVKSASYTVEANQSASIKGTASVTVESSGSLSIKASTISIEAKGPVTIKGATVMLG